MVIVFSGFTVLATAVCGLLAVLLYRIRSHSCIGDALPGPQPIPIFGNALHFSGKAKILDKLMELIHSYPSPFRIWAGSKLICFVYEPDHIQTVLNSPKTIEKAEFYRVGQSWLGDGLLTGPAKTWRIHRKLIMPTFNTKILESSVEVFAKQSEVMTIMMKKELQGGEFDISKYVSLCTIDILCESVMGIKLNVQTEENNRFVYSTRRALKLICTRMFTIWLHPDFIFNRTKSAKELNECLQYVKGITADIIQKKKSEYTNANRVNSDDSEVYPVKKRAFMDLLMELSNDGKKITDKELREEVDTMMLAGYDTTATVNCFILTVLAMYPEVQDTILLNPEIGMIIFFVNVFGVYRTSKLESYRLFKDTFIRQEKVYQELCDIYGDEVTSDTLVKHEDLNRMEYMERVIKETMRLFPLAPILGRRVTEDLKIGEYTLPKECTIIPSVFKIHRWEKYWPEPLKFDPDRFLPENVAKRHPYCYVPFSGGPRNCIGIKYAFMSMKTLIATVLRRYVLAKDKNMGIQDIKLEMGMVLTPVDKLTIKISDRRAVIDK